MLDARDPGELVEHATLSEAALDRERAGHRHALRRRRRAVRLSVPPGERLGQRAGRSQGDRLHAAVASHPARRAGGPDAFGCFSCHSKGGPDGAGTQTQNAFMRGDGERTTGADQRNPPASSSAWVRSRCLAREMSAELRAQRGRGERAREGGRTPRRAAADRQEASRSDASRPSPTARSTTAAVEGVDADLTVRPFGWKGHSGDAPRHRRGVAPHPSGTALATASSSRCATARSTLDPYGKGPWYDVDEDGVSLEIDPGMLTTVVGYLAQLEVPVMRPPHDPGLVDAWAAGRAHFDEIGCAGCHVPTLELEDTEARRARRTPDRIAPRSSSTSPRTAIGPKIEPKYAGDKTPYLVHLFSDLKRHDMGRRARDAGRRRGRSRRRCFSPARCGAWPRRRRTCTTVAPRPCTTPSCCTAARRPPRATPTSRSTSKDAPACASS